MDSKKLEALKNAAWHPAACCANCAHGQFGKGDWGLCGLSKNNYEHNKHKRMHQLPAHKTAVCRWYEPGPAAAALKEFLESEVTS